MVAAALILFAAAFVCFVLYAGSATLFGMNPLGLGLACCALYWFLSVLVPIASQ